MGTRRPVNKPFDYIVIGAGTAGGVVAKELSDDRKTSVLVLEAGTSLENSSPSGEKAGIAANNNKISFNILSNFEIPIGRPLRLWGGRVIGGSSQHNFMYAVRGSGDLYDEWARLVGSQWSYKNIRSLFKQNETYTGFTQSPNERGTKGPIFIRQQIIPDGGLIQTLTEATSDILGVPIVEDYNTGVRDCTFFQSQYTQKELNDRFVRSSTATGYLNRRIVTQGNEASPDGFGVGGRKLVILAKTTVNKILFHRKERVNVAVGVEYVRDGVTQKAFAKKGIIISAGIFTPIILQRSGIGRSTDLEEAGIAVRIESPHVGYNAKTHYYVGMGVEVETSRLIQVLSADPDQPYLLGAFKKDDKGSGRRLQYLGVPIPLFVPIQDVFINKWQFDPSKRSNVMSLSITDLNPTSTGIVKAAHSDPEAYPTVQFNPLDNLDDLNYMIDQYIEAYKVIKRAQELDPDGIYKVVYPSDNIFRMTNEEAKRGLLAEYVKASYTNLAHFGGHCRMGRTIHEGAVDGFLNVFGTQNLKIADLSAAPVLPDGNTSLAAQIIGLNAVRFIHANL